MDLTDKEISILIKSLEFISYFPKSLNTTPQEYLKIHQRNMETLSKLKSSFIVDLIGKYDDISQAEIKEYINWKKKEIGFVDLVFGTIISRLIGIIKNKGNTRKEIERKLNHISEINSILKKVINNTYP